jgi:hypothetical protein
LQLQQPPELLTHFKKERERERESRAEEVERGIAASGKRQKQEPARKGREKADELFLGLDPSLLGEGEGPSLCPLVVLAEGGSGSRRRKICSRLA